MGWLICVNLVVVLCSLGEFLLNAVFRVCRPGVLRHVPLAFFVSSVSWGRARVCETGVPVPYSLALSMTCCRDVLFHFPLMVALVAVTLMPFAMSRVDQGTVVWNVASASPRLAPASTTYF